MGGGWHEAPNSVGDLQECLSLGERTRPALRRSRLLRINRLIPAEARSPTHAPHAGYDEERQYHTGPFGECSALPASVHI